MTLFKAKVSTRRARAYSTAAMLVGLAVLAYTGNWWPGILLVIGLPIALREFLLGRPYDMSLTLLVFGGFYIVMQFTIPWQILMPIIFVFGALYILLREWIESLDPEEEEQEEDILHEIEEKSPSDEDYTKGKK